MKDLQIDTNSKIPVYIQIAESIMAAVRDGLLTRDQQIPSINELSEQYLLSRGTVEKAYKELRDKKVIISVKGKGYFINRTDIAIPLRVLLLFNKISNYKKQVYNAFVKTLGDNVFVDLHIHHHSVALFENLISNHLGDYDYYVIMPHFYEQPEKVLDILKKIPPGQLILLDKDAQELKGQYGIVYQNFEKDIYEALHEALPALKKYNSLVFVNPGFTPYPPEIEKGFRYFCRMQDFNFSVIEGIEMHTPVTQGQAYIIIEETDLVNLVKICRNNQLKIGEDVGIVSYNETLLKEILLDGITVISTDHEEMGAAAAMMIKDKQLGRVKNPFRLILRNSL
ncbi:GntR family transcriptional regulator [Chitinophaga pinensis]|uniref:Transcriptional regulator, GntR family n=1 Tax=Chitinophaga pinensis (strain ATCC 43595 / DSM 2588 / LMG 13176 / NBRC 15968 / NCIMB 11800 / UQM 2034) TaxID=485918 RepID=A0A979GRC8_CHIPD|nr:GntR family transcriptional regulator [Chitinophaga pinensis]ACU62242.1 transcriptional regulator, GntR family [Chitinophaga pinensis DSM 2588]